MSQPAHILVVDDDDRIRSLLQRYLTREGYRVSVAAHARAARALLQALDFDLCVLDVMMPGEDGLSLLQWMRSHTEAPVLMLTARGESADRITGLKSGADDYLVKPFEPEELALRIGSILRRAVAAAPVTEPAEPAEPIALSGLTFVPQTGILADGDVRIRLTETETALLTRLAETPGEAVERDVLAASDQALASRSVDVQINRLRSKIEPDPSDPVHIKTVRGVGYRLIPGSGPRS